MHVLFISNVYPPEVAPLANRLSEHARHWVADGGNLEVITPAPNYPEGELYPGYLNRIRREDVEGVSVMRVPTFITANEGTVLRILSFMTFMVSAVWFSRRAENHPDLVVASSPQFFSAIAGYAVSRLKQVPFVLEIRDLWPESIVAVGAMKRNAIVRMFERIEHYLYRNAEHIVVVTDTFKKRIAERGIDPLKISVIKNGADLNEMAEPVDLDLLNGLRREHRLNGKFIASYVGTVGMAHGTDVLLEAARQCEDPNIVFMVVGAGAEWDRLATLQRRFQLDNFRLLPKQSKHVARHLVALSDVSVVHLKDAPLFRTVIPSKIFESMALRRPIVLGVEGESRSLIEEANAGVCIPPENPTVLARAVEKLRSDEELYGRLSKNAYRYVHAHHDRKLLAQQYWMLMERVAGRPENDADEPMQKAVGVNSDAKDG